VTAASLDLDLEVEGAEGHGLDPAAIERLAVALLAAEGVDGPCALGIAFVGEGEMQALNAEHRSIDEVTDVLAFPLDGLDELPEGLERQLGDVVICHAQAVRQAAEAGVEPLAEVRTLVLHGLLHLLEYDHEADAGEMLARQDELVAALPQL
jgi:probable rRNA maturation factor